MRQFLVSIAFVLIASNLPGTAAVQSDGREPPSITVSGEGHVSVKPDLATASLGVTTESSTAKQALADNSKAMTQLIKAVADHGIADKDVQTGNFSVSPTYATGPNRTPKITGYTVQNSVQVKVRKLPELGPLLDDVVQSGANQIHSINFSVERPSRLLDDARQQAIEDAHRKAAIYANASGVRLGKVLYVMEGGVSQPHPRGALATLSSARYSYSTPIVEGEEDLSVTATVVFAIE